MRIGKILRIVVLAIIVIFIALGLIGYFGGDGQMHSGYSGIIKAEPAAAFAQMSDLKNWKNWSYWDRKDPEMTSIYSDPSSGVGAMHEWVSKDPNVGTGSVSIREIKGNEAVHYDLALKGLGTGRGAWKLKEVDGGTEVSADVDMVFTSKFMRIMVFYMSSSMKRTMEGAYMTCISNLENAAGAYAASAETSGTIGAIEIQELESIPVYSIRRTIRISEMAQVMGQDFPRLAQFVSSKGETAAGNPLAIYHEFNTGEGTTDVECAMPVESTSAGEEDIKISQTPGGKTLVGTYFGNYDGLGMAHAAFAKHMAEQGLEPVGAAWEWYITDPGNEPDPSKWETRIHYPVK